jgi:mannose-6-phosphate isomerase-like protein (cupin superfamily)
MAVVLQGGCQVSNMCEGDPVVAGTVKIWNQIGKATGAQAISLRILEFGPGLSPGLRNAECDEVLYMPEGPDDLVDHSACTLFIDGQAYEIAPQTGIYIRPGQILTVENRGAAEALFISSQCPEPVSAGEIIAPLIKPSRNSSEAEVLPVVRLADRKAVSTADRWYRVLVDEEVGSTQVTQFAGSIPPGRAPDHFHNYEEVLFILRGEGRMWAGHTSTTIGAGSCIYLPREQLHCVENTGQGELRLLGVFYPAGSPGVRYEA